MKTPLLLALFATSFLAASPALSGAPRLALSPEGVVINNGADAPLTLTFPTLVNETRKDIKPAPPAISDGSATLAYEGGGQVVVTLTADEVVFTASALPSGTRHLHTTMKIGPEYGGAGQWRIGDASKVFPQEKPASPFLHKGGGPDFALTGPTGVTTRVHTSAYCYNQMNDNREWHGDFFQWHAWIPVSADTSVYTMTVTVATAGAPSASSTSPVATVAQLVPKILPKEVLPALQNIADTRVLKWKDGKRAVFMLGFDDSASSHIKNVIPELKRRGIPGAFYINPGNGPYKNFQADWAREANSPGIELVNHTFTHIGGLTVDAFEQEIVKCNDVIDSLYPDRPRPRLRTFGRPGVPKNQWGITEAEIQQVLAKHHMIERPPFIGPPFSVKTIPDMIKFVDDAIAAGDMKQLVFHGVGGDWLVAPLDYFHATLDKLETERAQLWLTDPLSWHQYLTERKTAAVKVLASDASLIRLELTSQADPAFYQLPLSLQTKVPAAWKKCSVSQGATQTVVAVIDGEASYEAIPGAGPISLQPSAL